MKKIAFSTTGNDLSAELDPRFGRARQFLVYDVEAQTVDIIENKQNRSAAQGAGIQSAEAMIRAGVDTLITGHCGPKAFQVLEAAGIKVYNCSAATVQEALEMVQNGYLNPATAADKSEHW
ncbi:MAG: NifB/NifX family molybdenum-iron cluster-binding protein [Trichlorobacter sp.]|nr:NifB/NifX family molybdenum-iron cluster-binding protein [Trichlorobacter sp.]